VFSFYNYQNIFVKLVCNEDILFCWLMFKKMINDYSTFSRESKTANFFHKIGLSTKTYLLLLNRMKHHWKNYSIQVSLVIRSSIILNRGSWICIKKSIFGWKIVILGQACRTGGPRAAWAPIASPKLPATISSDLKMTNFHTLLKPPSIYEIAGGMVKIGSSLKLNHQKQI
jgi:hypothetical protein